MADLYPAKQKGGTTVYQWTKLIIAIGVILFAIWYFSTCNKKVETKPVAKPSVEIIQATLNVDSLKDVVSDSFFIALKNEKDKTVAALSKYDDLLAIYLNEQNDMSEALASKTIPDTCKEVVAALTGKFNTLKKTSADKDNAARNTITNLQSYAQTQKDYLAKKDELYNKLHLVLDTCVQGYQKLEKQVKKAQPKREVSAGINMMSGYTLPLKPEFGLILGYKNKKGTELILGYYTNNQIIIGLKKPLFKF